MNKKRFEKIIWELQKENSELNISKEKLDKTFEGFSVLSESMKPTEQFKGSLKSRLSAMSQYSVSEKYEKKNYLKFFIPVFSFWFAVFWIFYFIDDFSAPVQDEAEFAPYSISLEETADLPMWDLENTKEFSWEPDVQDSETLSTWDKNSKTTPILKSTPVPNLKNLDTHVSEVWITENTHIESRKNNEVTPAAVMSVLSDVPMDDSNELPNDEVDVSGDLKMWFMWVQNHEILESDENIPDVKSNEIDWFSIDSMIDEVFDELDAEGLDLNFEDVCKSYSGAVYMTGSESNSCILNSVSCLEHEFEKGKCEMFDKK